MPSGCLGWFRPITKNIVMDYFPIISADCPETSNAAELHTRSVSWYYIHDWSKLLKFPLVFLSIFLYRECNEKGKRLEAHEAPKSHMSKPCETLPCSSDFYDTLLNPLVFIFIALPRLQLKRKGKFFRLSTFRRPVYRLYCFKISH